MKLYTAGADINYIDWKIPVLFVIYLLLNYGRGSSNYVIGFEGAFKETQWRACLETVINLVVSLVLVFKIGVYGVLIGTIAALLYRANDVIIFTNRKILKRSPWPTYRKWILNLLIFVGVVFLFINVPMNLDSYFMIILNAIWVSVLVIFLFFGIISVFEKESRTIAKGYILDIVKKLQR